MKSLLKEIKKHDERHSQLIDEFMGRAKDMEEEARLKTATSLDAIPEKVLKHIQ